MKIVETLLNILEFLFAVLGFCLVISCISIALSESGYENTCLKINDYQSKGCIVQKEN